MLTVRCISKANRVKTMPVFQNKPPFLYHSLQNTLRIHYYLWYLNLITKLVTGHFLKVVAQQPYRMLRCCYVEVPFTMTHY